MTGANVPENEVSELSPATQKAKEQWLEEGHHRAFYAPVRYEEALAAYEKAIQLDPGYGIAYRMKGYTLHALKRDEEALAAYEQAIALDSTDAGAYSGKGDVLYGLKRYEEALTTYEQALHVDPDFTQASNGQAIALLFLNREEEALAVYDHIIRSGDDPSYVWMAYLNSGTLLASLSRYEESLAAFEAASRLEPDDASVWQHMGDVLTVLERSNEAKQAYERARQSGSGEDA
jgi:tetratricopeptide (TPR) repeat protein